MICCFVSDKFSVLNFYIFTLVLEQSTDIAFFDFLSITVTPSYIVFVGGRRIRERLLKMTKIITYQLIICMFLFEFLLLY